MIVVIVTNSTIVSPLMLPVFVYYVLADSKYSFVLRVGLLIQGLLEGCDLTHSGTPCSILFPASHGYGLTSTLLLHFLIDQHNAVIRRFEETKIGHKVEQVSSFKLKKSQS